MRQSLTSLIESIISTLWPLATNIWDAWGIQLLVVASFICQLILVHLGGRRRYRVEVWIRILVWASYLVASNIATIALGKLTVITIRNPENPEYNVELQALLAPLLLMHLAYPDSISAYAVEDTRMARRRAVMLLIQACVVIWILFRCFDSSSPISMFLYIPLFIAGIIKPVTTIFALASVYDDTISVKELENMRPKELPVPRGGKPTCEDDSNTISVVVAQPADDLDDVSIIWKAYNRFNCLQPHRGNWMYSPQYAQSELMSLDKLNPKDAFHVTEMELGFVYDVIYTQIPVVCTKMGLVGRGISITCLVSALIGFLMIYRSAFLLDAYVVYTYAILITSVIIELHQTISLPFFYTAVIALCNRVLKGKTRREKLVRACKGQRVWSNLLGQLNFVDYHLKDDFLQLWPLRWILQKFDREYMIKKGWRSTRVVVDVRLKEAIIEKMEELKITPSEISRDWKVDAVKAYMDREFDKCIIIWHIATEILLHRPSWNSCCNRNPSPSREREKPVTVSLLLSNYMMYLLAGHPYMLALATGDITLGYVSCVLEALLVNENKITHKEDLLDAIMETPLDDQLKRRFTKNYKTIITENWDVLADVQRLVNDLRKWDNGARWELIGGVWIKMLCYAAAKTQVYQHMTVLRRGGQLITHVWLLLRHKT